MAGLDDIRTELADAAASIDVGDPAGARAGIDHTVRRRRRRSRLVAALGVVALIAGGGAVIVAATGSDEPRTLVSSDQTETPDNTSPPDPSQPDPSPPDLSPVDRSMAVQVLDRAAVVGASAGTNGSPQFAEWAVPWRDGFLVGSTVTQPQPLPESLPEDIKALFPQEVIDLFGGQLPDTVSEATQMLSDAGLLDVVAEVIREHPEASAVIYGTPPSEPPSLDARFTTDGMTWEPVDVTLPAGVMYLSSVTTVGDRLVVAYSPQSPNSASPPDTAVVATTTDLVNWTTQVIPTSGPDIELPPEIMRSVSAQGLVANERGWAITVFESTEPDVLALIPAEDRARIEADNSGYGVSFDDAGIQVDLAFSDTGTATETLEYTWAELGIAPEVAEYLGGNQYEPRVWAATWDGTPSVSTDAPWSDQLLATPAGFVQFTDRTLFSTDGLSWTASPLPDPDGVVTASFAFDGGVIALSDSGDGATVYRLDERGGSPELLDLSDLPAQVRSGFSPQSPSRSAVIVDVLDPEARPEPRVVEFEGYRVTVDDLLGRYEVVETATGDIVASERVGATGFAEGSNLAFDADGLVVTDPTTGDVVVAIPHEALYAAPSDAPGDAGWSEYLPDLWLLASVDGEHFVVDDLVDDVAAEDGFGGPVVLVANDDQLLVNLGGAWLHYDLS